MSDIDILEHRIAELEMAVTFLQDDVKRLKGWTECPHCGVWHEPDGLTLEKCGCGYNFRSRKCEG